MKKNYDIPTLNFKKAPLRRSDFKTQIDKISTDQEIGFMSERNAKRIENKHNEMKSTSPKKVSSNLHNTSDSSINLFFYKNFNKFIQNLYIQEEQDTKKSKKDGKKNSKLSNNPYSKEIVAISSTMRKSSQNKRVNQISTTKNRISENQNQNTTKFSSSFVKNSQKEEIKKGSDVNIHMHLKKNFYSNKEKSEETHKLMSKLLKSASFKTVPGLDLAKVRESQEKYKIKHISPRD